MQKQARKWPVSVSVRDLCEDVKTRFEQSFNGDFDAIPDPFTSETGFAPEYVEEYGIDCCRIANIVAQNEQLNQTFLDSAFKWLSRFFENRQEQPQQPFRAAIWLEMILQAKDQVFLRHNQHRALACIRHAAKASPPNKDLNISEQNLVALAIYPFAPVFSLNLLSQTTDPRNIQNLLGDFQELMPVRFSIEKGGWHWGVFPRNSFNQEPLDVLLTRKWVRSACAKRKPILKKIPEGWQICLS